LNDIERQRIKRRISQLRNFRPILPPFPEGTIPEREKTNEDFWVEAQGFCPYVNIQLLGLVPLCVLMFFPDKRYIPIPFAVLGQRATLRELSQVSQIYKKRIHENEYLRTEYQEHLHGYNYYRTPTERYYYDKAGEPLKIETNLDNFRPGVHMTLKGKNLDVSHFKTDGKDMN